MAEMPAIYSTNNLDMLLCMVSTDDATMLIWYGDDAEAAVTCFYRRIRAL